MQGKLDVAQNRFLRLIAGALSETPVKELEKELFVENIQCFLERRARTTRAKFISTTPYNHLCLILDSICQRFPVTKCPAAERRRLYLIADPSEHFSQDKELIKYACEGKLDNPSQDIRRRNILLDQYTKAIVQDECHKQWADYAAQKKGEERSKDRICLYDEWGEHNIRRHDQLTRQQSSALIRARVEKALTKATIARYNSNIARSAQSAQSGPIPNARQARPRFYAYISDDEDDDDDDTSPNCPCGAEQQTVRHLIFECADLEASRRELARKTGTSSPLEWFNTHVQIASKWIIRDWNLRQNDWMKEYLGRLFDAEPLRYI